MKYIIVFVALLFTTSVYSQNKFVFNENGLVPQYTLSNIDSMSEPLLYKKTLKWVENTYKYPDTAIDTHVENDFIDLTAIKNNAVHKGKFYFHLKYTIKISFEKGKYKFEPIKIMLKANSKYDMGWKDFNFKNGASFFKKHKAIKTYKSYVTDIPSLLNELNNSLYNYLMAED